QTVQLHDKARINRDSCHRQWCRGTARPNRDLDCHEGAGSPRSRPRRADRPALDTSRTGIGRPAMNNERSWEAATREGNRITQNPTPHDALSDRNEVTLEGCNPLPLSAYLKALGILRLVAEQVDAEATGSWRK